MVVPGVQCMEMQYIIHYADQEDCHYKFNFYKRNLQVKTTHLRVIMLKKKKRKEKSVLYGNAVLLEYKCSI